MSGRDAGENVLIPIPTLGRRLQSRPSKIYIIVVDYTIISRCIGMHRIEKLVFCSMGTDECRMNEPVSNLQCPKSITSEDPPDILVSPSGGNTPLLVWATQASV